MTIFMTRDSDWNYIWHVQYSKKTEIKTKHILGKQNLDLKTESLVIKAVNSLLNIAWLPSKNFTNTIYSF